MKDGFPTVWPGPAGGVNADGRIVDILLTHAPPRRCGDREDPPYRRLFLERVPLTGHARASVVFTEPWDYARHGFRRGTSVAKKRRYDLYFVC